MVVISVDISDKLAKKISTKEVISIDVLYEIDQTTDNWKTVDEWENASVVLDYLKKIK